MAWTAHGAMVPYVGLFDSIPRLLAMLLLGVWVFATGFLMWRDAARPLGRPTDDRDVPRAAVA